jgi:flavorubredoxin
MSRVTEIAPEVFAMSNLIVAEERVSWIAHGMEGYEPHHQYLLRRPYVALLIDTGMKVHVENIVAAIRELIGDRQLIVYTTRSEPDCVGNLAHLVSAFPRLRLVNASVLNPSQLVHLPQGFEARDIPLQRLRYGQTLDSVGFPHVHVIEPLVRLLGTSWLYDGINHILFSSDYLDVELMALPEDDVVRSTTQGQPDVAHVRAGILAKFAWLAHADTDVLTPRWDAYFAKTKPRILAPSHGRIVSGEDVVALALDNYRRAAFNPEQEGRRPAAPALS